MPDPLPQQTTTGTSARTVTVGEPRTACLVLDDERAAMIHWALWIAYGNRLPVPGFWNEMREALGEDWWPQCVDRGSEIGRLYRP